MLKNFKKAFLLACLTSIIMLVVVFVVVKAGSLTPPGPVGSTMHTLQEIYDAMAGTFNSSSQTANINGNIIQQLKYISGMTLQQIYNSSAPPATIVGSSVNTILTLQQSSTGDIVDLTGNSITTGTGLALTANGLTTGTGVNISSTSTAGGASGVSKLLNLSRSGANANASHTAYGLYSAVTDTGATSTNIGGYFSASGATNNYGLIVENGNVGIGTATPVSKLDVRGAIENGLVGWWPMDEGTGTTAVDYSIGGHNGAFVNSACPSGYVLVPGNATYGTGDFCVMQYEAKNVGGVATSQASGNPWVSISQTSAITTCASAGGHLITNNEWMTIARNMEAQLANWSGGAVGSGTMARGWTDGGNTAVAPSTESSCLYNTAANTCGSSGTKLQQRTLVLSNGQTVWDFSGNVWEWTNDTIQGKDEPTSGTPGWSWREFTALTTYGTLTYDKVRPAGASYNSAQGVGQIYSDGTASNTMVYAFLRGGNWFYGADAGAFALDLTIVPSDSSTSVGFRCVR